MTAYKVVADDQEPGNARWLLVVVEDDGSEWPSIVFKSKVAAERALDRATARGLITDRPGPSLEGAAGQTQSRLDLPDHHCERRPTAEYGAAVQSMKPSAGISIYIRGELVDLKQHRQSLGLLGSECEPWTLG